MTDGIARFKDFTGADEPIQFAIRGEVFTALDDIPLKHLSTLASLGESLSGDGSDKADSILSLFEKILVPESFKRFQDAVNGQSDTVIGISRAVAIIQWLMEQYGLRPTGAPSGSSTTSEESGESSTDGALLVDATS